MDPATMAEVAPVVVVFWFIVAGLSLLRVFSLIRGD